MVQLALKHKPIITMLRLKKLLVKKMSNVTLFCITNVKLNRIVCPNYAWEKDFLKLPIDIDDVHSLIEFRYEYDEYPRRMRIEEYSRVEELLIEEEEIAR